MGADEAGTMARLEGLKTETLVPLIAQHHGRVVKLMGDGFLVEFASVVDALTCALAWQEAVEDRAGQVSEEQALRFRIGVNLGDVMVKADDLYGEGVNVAARLEGLAEPGSILVSQTVFDHAKGKVAGTFEDLGARELKNIAEPVRVFQVSTAPEVAKTPAIATAASGSRRLAVIAASAVVLVVAVGVALWLTKPWAPREEPAEVADVALPSPDKPSVAVLPFANLSDDPSQEYFADGMTEDLITDLSKISGLTVISRTSTSGYKGRQIDVREVGKALDVRYVIEGSVRKAGEQVRINAQLIDATTGGHLWAERYDGSMSDIFGLQDQVLEKIVASLALKLTGEERQRLVDKGTDSVAAHDLYLRGLFQEATFTREGFHEAMQLYEQALSIDPDYALPYARMANILELSTRNGWSDDIRADLRKAVELAEKAVTLDPQNPNLHWSLGRAAARLRTPEALKRGIESLQRAIELDSDFADAYAYLTVLYIADGRAEDGLRTIETAMRLNPRYPFWYLFMRGMAQYVIQDYDAAIADFETAAERSPTVPFLRWWLAASYAQIGQMEDAEWQVEELDMMGVDVTIATIVETQPIQHPEYLALYKEGLRKAGIPE
jgi:TolB-like protein/Flp pilus assembly protein TadD